MREGCAKELKVSVKQNGACCHFENDDKWVWVRANFLSKEKDYIDRIGHTIVFVSHH